jgi:hypothetical protein
LLAGSGRKPKIPINTRGTQFASTNWTFFLNFAGEYLYKKGHGRYLAIICTSRYDLNSEAERCSLG